MANEPHSEPQGSPKLGVADVAGCQLATATWGQGQIDIVMLHDGLGSIGQWRSVPAAVAALTGRTVLAYERAGHGSSTPIPDGPWPADWLHREAVVFDELLSALDIDTPFVVGHSDGGSTALIHAATTSGRVRGVLAIAPHSWVEDICRTSIIGMRANRDRMVAGLAKHHVAPSEIFEAWSGVWVSDEFQAWDIRPMLSAIEVPTLIAQGRDDAYASDEQAILSAEAIGPNGSWALLDDVGHIAHHDDANKIAQLIADTWSSCTPV